MNIVVCIKQVPDTKGGVKFNPDGTLVNTIELDRRKMSNLYYGDDKYLFIGYSNKLSYIDKSNISSSVEIVPVK